MTKEPSLSEILLYFSSRQVPVVDIIGDYWVPAQRPLAVLIRGAHERIFNLFCEKVIEKDLIQRIKSYEHKYDFNEREEFTDKAQSLTLVAFCYLISILDGRTYRNFYDFLAERKREENKR